jgi:MerR family transcriptional regulator, light-induced transcriptional regulator
MPKHPSTQAQSDLLAALLAGDRPAARRVVESCLADAVSPADVHWVLLQPALETIGEQWARGEITVAEEHLATAVGEHVLGAVYPSLVRHREALGRQVILAGAEGERHVLGLRAVGDVLDGAGFDVLALGADVPPASVADLAARLRPAAVGLSVSLSAHLPAAVRAVTLLRALQIPVVVGGSGLNAPLDEALGVYAAADGRHAVELFERAIAESADPEPIESSDDALRRAVQHEGVLREAIAADAAALAGHEVDQLRATMRRLR